MTIALDPSRYRYIPGETIVEDIDLDETPIYIDGKRYTEADALRDSLEAERLQRAGLVPGGKSLSGGHTHSPRFQLVLGEQTAEQVRQAARAEHMSISRWLRRTVEEKLAA
jgi:hypothetical protein